MEFQYRCVAADESGGRCSDPAVEIVVDATTGETEGRLCQRHFNEGLRDPESLREAPRPDIVLVKFFIGEQDFEIAERIRRIVPQQKRNEQAIRERHRQQEMVRYGEKGRFKKGPHSGSPVFRHEGIDGLRRVVLPGLFDELRQDGYRLESIAWFASGQATVLQISFRKNMSDSGPEIEMLNSVREFEHSSFAECYVWANPPKEGGTVIHTVNFKGVRDPHDKMFASYELLFVAGDWYVKRVSA